LHNKNGGEISTSQIKQGEPFWIVFRVRSTATKDIENMALSSIFPSSFEISNDRVRGEESDSPLGISLSVPDYMDIRDDRVNMFFDLRAGQTKTFAVQIHPSYEGVFWWPGLVLEAMYSPDYFARISGERVRVE
jgi:uncharacterized protein YfaS (alpha-2-macroglobulin family)